MELKTGEQVTQQEVLTRLVERAFESKADLIDSFRPERVPVSQGEREALHEGMVASGVETTEEDIDDIRYG